MAGGGTLTLETDGKVVIGAADALAYRQTHTQVGAQQPQPCCSIRRCWARASRNTTSTAVTACGWPRARRWTWRCRCTDTSRATRPRASGRRRRCCWRRYTRRTRSGALTQRAGADLTLRSQRIEDGADIDIGAGALVSVDPPHDPPAGRRQQPYHRGRRLRAPGGRIEADIVAPASDVRDNPASRTHNRAIWIGGAATLDVAGRAAGGVDIDGRRYGQAQAGGSILLGGALDWDATGIAESARDIAIVVRPGAVLDASGSRLAIDAPRGSRLGTLDLAGDGGQIVLKSSYGLFLDGDMRARAGAGAAGGTLALALETPTFPLSVNAEDGVRRPRELILSQGTQASGLASDLAGAARSGAASWRRLSARQFEAGGFGNLSLLVNGILSFDGDVALSASQSLRFYAGSYAVTDRAMAGTAVSLSAPHLRLAAARAWATASRRR